MGLLDKFKNLFTDEEIVEVTKEIEVEDKIEPPKLPKVMQDQIEKLELTKQIIKDETPVSDRELIKTRTKFNFPVEFDNVEVPSNKNVLTSRVTRNSEGNKPIYNMSKKELENTRQLYGADVKKEEPPVAKKFYSSPIISPVYGVLDKNYKKEELRAKDENSYEIPRTNKKVDFETVRKKAFGTLADEIKDSILCDDCELKKASLKLEHNASDGLLYDITIEKQIKEEKEEKEDNYNDFGVSYEVEEDIVENIKPTKIDIEVEIDNSVNINTTDETDTLENDILNNTVEIVNCNENEVVAEKIEVKEPPKKTKAKDNLELTDDLFNLIDSMYQDREE